MHIVMSPQLAAASHLCKISPCFIVFAIRTCVKLGSNLSNWAQINEMPMGSMDDRKCGVVIEEQQNHVQIEVEDGCAETLLAPNPFAR
jgi:hypothetical protein